MRYLLLLLATLLLTTPARAQEVPAYVIAVRGPAGIVLAWHRPADQWGCIKFVGINPDAYLEDGCKPDGALILDAGQIQFAGQGRMVGLWGADSTWIAGPVPLPGFEVVLPIVAQPMSTSAEPRMLRVGENGQSRMIVR